MRVVLTRHGGYEVLVTAMNVIYQDEIRGDLAAMRLEPEVMAL